MTMQEFPEHGGLGSAPQFQQFAAGDVYSLQSGMPEVEVSPEERVEQAKQQLAEFWHTHRERVLDPIQNGGATLEHAEAHAKAIKEGVTGSAARALTTLIGFYQGASFARDAATTAEDNLTTALEKYEASHHPQTLQRLFGGLPGAAEAAKGLYECAIELREATSAKQEQNQSTVHQDHSSTEQATTDTEPTSQSLEAAQAQWLVESLDGQLPTLNWMAPRARDLVEKFINPYDLLRQASQHRTQALSSDKLIAQLEGLKRAMSHVEDQAEAAVRLATGLDQVSSILFAWAHNLDAGINVIVGSAIPSPGAQT